MQKPTKIAYICDGKRTCRYYGACQVDCFHTFNDLHTKNGVIHFVDELLNTDRFRKVGVIDDVIYYEEIMKGE